MELSDYLNKHNEELEKNKDGIVENGQFHIGFHHQGEGLHVIGTCGECKYWIKADDKLLTHWCDVAKVCCPEHPHKDFGCIHFEPKEGS